MDSSPHYDNAAMELAQTFSDYRVLLKDAVEYLAETCEPFASERSVAPTTTLLWSLPEMMTQQQKSVYGEVAAW